MQIVVFGATGGTGREVIDQALTAGHRVTAVARRAGSLPPREGLVAAAADIADPAAVDAAVRDTDAVLSVVGGRFSRKPITLYSVGTGNIVAAMHRHGVKRLLAVSSSVTDPDWRPTGSFFFNHVLDPLVNRKLGRTLHEDLRRMESLIRTSGLDWTIVRPSGLFDHPAVTEYRTAEDHADGLFTARPDLAASMLAALGDDRYVGKAMAVITPTVTPSIAGLIWREAVKKK
jgi:uncharacterized protein YbjT (DUF2867 family)